MTCAAELPQNDDASTRPLKRSQTLGRDTCRQVPRENEVCILSDLTMSSICDIPDGFLEKEALQKNPDKGQIAGLACVRIVT